MYIYLCLLTIASLLASLTFSVHYYASIPLSILLLLATFAPRFMGGGGASNTALLGVTWGMFRLTPTEMFESEVPQEDFRHILLRFLLYLYFFHEKYKFQSVQRPSY